LRFVLTRVALSASRFALAAVRASTVDVTIQEPHGVRETIRHASCVIRHPSSVIRHPSSVMRDGDA